MAKAETRHLIDLASLITFVINAVSGYTLWLMLPSGSKAEAEKVFPLARHSWTTLHDHSGLIFTVAIVLHL